MNIEWLADFLVLAETGNFTRAAEKRAVTHSAFGRRIKLLEEWAGAELVKRTQPASLTTAGKIFLKAAEDVTTTLANVRLQLQTTTPGARKIRIATGHILASHFFPRWYRAIRALTPFVPFSISSVSAQYAVTRFIDREADLLIAYQTPMTGILLAGQAYLHKTLGRETILPVTADPEKTVMAKLLAGKRPIDWLGYDASLSLKSPVIRHLGERGIYPRLHPVLEADSYSALKRMVLEDAGIAWLPASVVQAEIRTQKLFVIEGEKLPILVNIAIFRRRDENDAHLLTIWEALDRLPGLTP